MTEDALKLADEFRRLYCEWCDTGMADQEEAAALEAAEKMILDGR